MQTLFKEINKKINGVIWSFVSTGIIMLLLSGLFMWDVLVLQLTGAMFILLFAYIFLYTGYKLWTLKKSIEKHFKF